MKRSVFFDVLRVVCILNVIAVIHARQYSGKLCQAIDSHFPAWGYIVGSMAALFFASGYLLSTTNAISNAHDVVVFAKKRVLRILPLYVVALATIPFHASAWRKASMLIGINNFMGFTLSTLWFVSVLIVFYMLFPIMEFLKRRELRYALLLALIVEAFFVVGSRFLGFEARMLYYFPFFVLGVAAADSKMTERQMFFVAIPVVAVYFLLRLMGWLDGVEVVLRPLRFFVILVVAYITSMLFPFRRFWGMLAYASFCAYLFHRQIYDVFLHKWFHLPDGLWRCLLIYALVPLTFVAGYCIQFGYDRVLRYIHKAEK